MTPEEIAILQMERKAFYSSLNTDQLLKECQRLREFNFIDVHGNKIVLTKEVTK